MSREIKFRVWNPNFGKHKSMESRMKMSEKAKIREMRKRGEIIGK